MRVIDHLIKAIRAAAVFNPEVQITPACILWPDHDRQWEAVIPRLQMQLPELVVLGDYTPEKRIGPAIWLRCVVAKKTGDLSLPDDLPPIFYLPGISRQDLRAVESCPDPLKPLAELQYRGVIWSQLNAKDWTILAFFKSDQGGLGLDVAQDNDAKNAMQLAPYRLLDEEIELLKNKKLDKDYFNKLLSGGDPVRDLLQWLDQGDAFQNGRGGNEWKAFVEICKSQLAFNPAKEGVLAGAVKLATHEGPWRAAWERFCEAPRLYPNIPARIRQCSILPLDLFSNAASHGSWPQWNDSAETRLRNDIQSLSKFPPHEVRKRIADLEKKHQSRRKLIWAELGESPLALALEHLTIVAEVTTNTLAAGSIDDMVAVYQTSGWRADNAIMRALDCVAHSTSSGPENIEAVSSVIRCIYMPWLEDSARYLQKIVDQAGYQAGHLGGVIAAGNTSKPKEGECIFFVDGLRFDVAKRLKALLANKGCQIEEQMVWAALPSVTGTGKPAVSPIKDKILGKDANIDFEPCVKDTGQSLKGGYHFKKLLTDAGWSLLENADLENTGNAWYEFGNIDHEGHIWGWKLSKQVDGLLNEICARIVQLITKGWKNIRVVTDHGWLLMPGGLPKIDLSSSLTDNKWGRCAVFKPGAAAQERMYPWYWNPNQHFALADGISCFRKGLEYAHGGLSLQECLTLELHISAGDQSIRPNSLNFTDVVWKGLRCTVVVDGQCPELYLDIRLQPGDPSSSVAVGIKPLKDDGTSSVVIENEEFQGKDAMIVLVDSKGELVAQVATVIGGVGK